jgi:hypothetical protein
MKKTKSKKSRDTVPLRKRKRWEEGRAGTRKGWERESGGKKERVGRRKK